MKMLHNAGGGLMPLTIPDNGKTTKLPALPLEMGGHRFGARLDLPHEGEHSREILSDLGYGQDEIDALVRQGVIGVGEK